MAVITGTAGNDTLTGEDYSSTGPNGDDTIHGGAGDDLIDGLAGRNLLFGDDGDDTLVVTAKAFSGPVLSSIDGGSGFDTLQINTENMSIFLQESGATASTTRSPPQQIIDAITGIERIVIKGVGLFSASTISLAGSSQGYELVNGGQGALTFITGSGNDTIIGGASTDSIFFNGGHDIASGGGGGFDRYYVQTVTGNDLIEITGSADTDELVLLASAVDGRGATIDLAAGTGLIGGAGLASATLTFTSIEDVSIEPSLSSVTVFGSDGANRLTTNVLGVANLRTEGVGIELHGRGGADWIQAGTGDDRLFGDDGDDSVFGQEGADTIQGGAGEDILSGDAGNDVVDGGDGHDWIYGGTSFGGSGTGGSDTLSGGAGNDHIYGHELFGSAGDNANDGGDLIDGGDGADYANGNGGDDTINGGAGSDRLLGGRGNDSISGGADADQVNGNVGNDTISGGDGNDVLRGGQGDDRIVGDAGNDIMFGDLGNDTLVAGAGVDVMAGGNGADLFDLSAGDAAAIDPSGIATAILDFVHGTDDLKLPSAVTAGNLLTDVGSFASVATAQAAAQALLSGHAGTTDVAILQVGADSYLFYNAAGTADAITAIVQLSGVSAGTIDIGDFT